MYSTVIHVGDYDYYGNLIDIPAFDNGEFRSQIFHDWSGNIFVRSKNNGTYSSWELMSKK